MSVKKSAQTDFAEHRNGKLKLNIFVFSSAAISVALLSCLTIFWPENSATFLTKAQAFVSCYLSWYYTLIVIICLVFTIWLACSRHGQIRLGNQDETPDFSYIAWASMLFSAGIGIALVYFGAYEPLDHLINPPTGAGNTPQAAQSAMVITFLHWGVHGWALYALMATVLAYYAYVEKRPLNLRTALYPIFGEKWTQGIVGDLVDAFGILATIIAMVTNLGIGALLVQAGMAELFGFEQNLTTLVFFIVIMSAFAIVIAVIGIEKGIATLSKLNIILLCLLLGFVFVLGPTAHILDGLVQNTGDYLSHFIQLSFNLYIFENASDWRGLWTIFYWAWWIAWAPFVGLFIARISKGRSIRELILGVMFIPLAFTLVWLAVFGNAALDMVFLQGNTALGQAVVQNPEMAIYHFLDHMPFSRITIFFATIVSFILFFAPVDSGSLMVANLTLKTKDPHAESPAWLRVFWCVATASVTVGLFLSGNFTAIQTAVVLCGLPFSLVMIAYLTSFFKTLQRRKP